MAVSGSMSATLGAANPLRYRGYVYDSETSLYYLSSRYYNPVWGRFINADTAAVVAASPDKANWDKNLFAYCDNDPVSRKDDGGDLWEEITTLGDSIFRSALIFGGLAIGAAVLSAFVVGTGGAGAIAIPTYIASMNWMRFWPQTRESLPKSKTPKESVEHPVHLAICVPGKVTLTQFGPS